MALEMSTDRAICSRCGTAFGRRKGSFPVCYGQLYKGTGYLHICKNCVEKMYQTYLSECNNAADAARQMCRKLDLFWSPSTFEAVLKTSTARSVFSSYLTKLNTATFAGKSYDDSLSNEGMLWVFGPQKSQSPANLAPADKDENDSEQVVTQHMIEINDDVIEFWGPGYTPSMYSELEQRYKYWMARLPDGVEVTVGLEGLLRQICSLEIDINKARAAGASTDKLVASLNTLIGSAMLKPTQSSDSGESSMEKTPFGVWIKRWEDNKPIPEPDPQFKDVDGVVRYIEVWFKGHLSKMLGLRNSYSKMYEEEMEKYRLELPEYEDEDSETLFNDIFAQQVDTDNE